MELRVERVYGARPSAGGTRVLVDRVWPRGITKDSLKLDLWLRELAPSTELRKWFGHDPKRWEEFQRRYHSELERPEHQGQLNELRALGRKGPVTLLYGARDENHNQAVALRNFLEESTRARK